TAVPGTRHRPDEPRTPRDHHGQPTCRTGARADAPAPPSLHRRHRAGLQPDLPLDHHRCGSPHPRDPRRGRALPRRARVPRRHREPGGAGRRRTALPGRHVVRRVRRTARLRHAARRGAGAAARDARRDGHRTVHLALRAAAPRAGARRPRRPARGHPVGRLRPVGHRGPRAGGRPRVGLAEPVPRLVPPVRGRGVADRADARDRRRRAGRDDPADHHGRLARGVPADAAAPRGGGARAGRDPVGDGADRGAALRPLRRHLGRDARPRPRARRDHGRADDPVARLPLLVQGVPGRAAPDHRGVHRPGLPGGERPGRQRAHRDRSRAVRHHPRGQHGRPGRRGPPQGLLGSQLMSTDTTTPDATERTRALLTTAEPRRRRTDRIMTVLIWGAFVLAMVPLVSLLWTVLFNGAGRISIEFLTYSMRGIFGGDPSGGIYHAVAGTLIITGWATVISVPVGLLVAIYLVEYGRGPLARSVTFFVDVMTGIPSIVAGLFAVSLFTIFFGPGARFGLMGAVALSVLMIPVVVRSCEEMLKLVPNELREASYALGVP